MSYKNDLIFNFINFNENFINRNEIMERLNWLIYKMAFISANKSPKMLKMASNDCWDNAYHFVPKFHILLNEY